RHPRPAARDAANGSRGRSVPRRERAAPECDCRRRVRARGVADGRWRDRLERAGRRRRHASGVWFFVHAMGRGAAAVRPRPSVRAGSPDARRSRGHGLSMAIIVKLDDLLYARRMTLTELSEKVGITLANLSILK